MPFGNGTGPRGMGPMTGRGAGYCTGFARTGIPGGSRFSFNRSIGRGMGLGFRSASPPPSYIRRKRGIFPRCGNYFSGTGTAASQITREAEINSMRARAEEIQNELQELEAGIEKLSAEQNKE